MKRFHSIAPIAVASTLLLVAYGCGGGSSDKKTDNTPTPTPSVTDTPTPTPSVTDTPTPTPSVTNTPTPTPTPTATPAIVAPSVIVSSRYNNTAGLIRYDANTQNFRSFTASGSTAYKRYALASDGTIYFVAPTSGSNSRKVQPIRPDGTLGSAFTALSDDIEDITVLPSGNVLVRNDNGYFVYDKNTGIPLSSSGAFKDDYFDVYDMKVGPDGKVYVAGNLKGGGYAVKRYLINAGDTLSFEAQIITFTGSGVGITNALTFTSDNKLILVDLESHALALYDLDGNYQSQSFSIPSIYTFAQTATARSVFTTDDEMIFLVDQAGVFRVGYTAGANPAFTRIDGAATPSRWLTDSFVADIAVQPFP